MRLALKKFACLILLASSSPALSQTSNRPLRATPVLLLKFPAIVMIGNASGTVTIDAATGTTSTTGSIRIMSGGGSPATLDISGAKDSLISVRTASTADLVASSGQIVQLQNVTSTGQGGLRLSRNGQAEVSIGATLPVSMSTQAGNYRGRIIVSVDYVFE